ncbi:unnamed protein product [marine sediment metagenome]|uniref:Uncharacterized protein n=1 Tax=marine sediment metagenome TaxID=412755 RepID=X1GJE3_9ZZZZ
MGRQAEPARMGYALAVDNEYIRLTFKFFDRSDTDRSFAKREQAGYVGKGNFS